MIVRPLLPLVLALCTLAAACRKAEIASYRVPKEKDPEMPVAAATPPTPAAAPATPAAEVSPPSNMAQTTVATAQGAALVWTAPSHWKAKPASPMRKGSYAVSGESGPDADMSITAFPNDVGGELANVNRWRGQIKLAPVAEADLATIIVRHDHNGLKFGEVDLLGTGDNPQRILGAWVAFGGGTWFFKLMGPDAIVGKEKAAFAAFIDSIRPADTAASKP